MPRSRHVLIQLVAAALLSCLLRPAWPMEAQELAAAYRSEVQRSLALPHDEAQRYGQMAESALAQAGLLPARPQYLVVVDRNPRVQALVLFWRSAQGEYLLVGASPVSTGAPGRFDHFETPLGVFDHSLENPDFRAEGTLNENGIRGYGARGMRVFDFGWQQVPKGWGDRRVIDMRLQLHATDPDLLERRLGSAQSKGCIRIPAGLNRLIDHYGLLDADYQRELRVGETLWVLDPHGEPVPDPGRYMIVVDTQRERRPDWSPAPGRGRQARARAQPRH